MPILWHRPLERKWGIASLIFTCELGHRHERSTCTEEGNKPKPPNHQCVPVVLFLRTGSDNVHIQLVSLVIRGTPTCQHDRHSNSNFTWGVACTRGHAFNRMQLTEIRGICSHLFQSSPSLQHQYQSLSSTLFAPSVCIPPPQTTRATSPVISAPALQICRPYLHLGLAK